MRIHRSHPVREFLTIPNETLRDERLSFAARGHLAYLLSLPDGWHTSADDEARRARSLRSKRGEGRPSMRAIYAELKNAGYIRLVKLANTSGQWTTEAHVYDRPFADVQDTDVPETCTSVPPAEISSFASSAAVSVLPDRTDVQETGSQLAERRSTDTSATCTSKQKTGKRRREKVQSRVGDPIADKEQPNANSHKPRVHVGPGKVADDVQQFPSHDSESATTGGNARASDADERADFEAHRTQQLDLLAAWMRTHPETDTP